MIVEKRYHVLVRWVPGVQLSQVIRRSSHATIEEACVRAAEELGAGYGSVEIVDRGPR